jgi:pimeloyl-ACP methyl ester carboxylesterase
MSTWVLLRGLSREQAHWGGFPTELARVMPGARIVCVDLPGAGVLHEQPSPWRVEAMVDACQRQLAGQGVAPPFRLLGLSLGGMVAAAWSRAEPQAVAGLVLVNTSLRPYSPPQRRLRLATLPRLLWPLVSGDALALERAVLHLTSQQPEQHADVLQAWLQIRQTRPVSAANTVRQLAAAARYRWSGPAPAMPVLVLRSAGVGLVDPACSQRIAQAWQAALRSHPSAGHDLALDDGPWLAAQVAAWAAATAG